MLVGGLTRGGVKVLPTGALVEEEPRGCGSDVILLPLQSGDVKVQKVTCNIQWSHSGKGNAVGRLHQWQSPYTFPFKVPPPPPPPPPPAQHTSIQLKKLFSVLQNPLLPRLFFLNSLKVQLTLHLPLAWWGIPGAVTDCLQTLRELEGHDNTLHHYSHWLL